MKIHNYGSDYVQAFKFEKGTTDNVENPSGNANDTTGSSKRKRTEKETAKQPQEKEEATETKAEKE